MPHVTFIHGIANKPDADRLLTLWEQALAVDGGIDLGTKGIGSSMVYWADVLYAEPAAPDSGHESTGAEVQTLDSDEDLSWIDELSDDESAFCASLREKLNFDAESPEGDDFQPPEVDDAQLDAEGSQIGFERIPLPWSIKRRLMKSLLRDVHHYLFNVEHSPRPGESFMVQEEIRRRFIDTLNADAADNDGGPHIVVSHSMGTVISYDCLKRVDECPPIDAYMTIGSPLGIDEVQDKLQPGWSRKDGYPVEKMPGAWFNVYDRLDPVAFDTKLANDFRQGGDERVNDKRVRNDGLWRHDIAKYMRQDKLRNALTEMLGL